MKVILLKDVAKVGQHGTIKEVSDGYALNFLIARGLAVQATAEKVKQFEAQVKTESAEKEKREGEVKGLIESLEGKRIEMKVRATAKGGLFKSITVADIKKALGTNIPEDAIQLEKPIKQTGEHEITIASGNAKAKMILAVVASD